MRKHQWRPALDIENLHIANIAARRRSSHCREYLQESKFASNAIICSLFKVRCAQAWPTCEPSLRLGDGHERVNILI